MTEEEIIAIRDDHLPSQGQSFDCIAFARALIERESADAERYRWLRGDVPEHSTRWPRWRVEYWDGPNGWQPLQGAALDSAVDRARSEREGG